MTETFLGRCLGRVVLSAQTLFTEKGVRENWGLCQEIYPRDRLYPRVRLLVLHIATFFLLVI